MSDPSPGGRRRFQILVCDGPSCGLTYESDCLKRRIEERIAANPDLNGRAAAVDFTCFGRCDEGPNMLVREVPEGEDVEVEPDFGALDGVRGFYVGNDEGRVDRLVDEHMGQGKPIEEWVEEY